VADDFTDVLPLLDADSAPRLVVLGRDAALAAVLTYLLRNERLSVELGFVAAARSPATRALHISTGNAAAARALSGTAMEVPLIRDDTGTALAGHAKITGAGGGAVEGEAYVDDTRLFTGTVRALHVVPTLTLPGVAACAERGRWRRPRWVEGRALQLGTPAAVLARDGVQGTVPVKRASFYRHHEPWRLVR
jgi:hypothetical protein